MELILERDVKKDTHTLGKLSVNGAAFCYTLEDPIRKEKIKGETAIPEGKYEIIVSYSNRFKKRMPLLLNVPKFNGIRIHAGNTVDHTEGCLLVGMTRTINEVRQSRLAQTKLYEIIFEAVKKEKIWIEIK